MSGPSDFSRRVAECPLRFVIADDLTRASAELAFADGDRLAGCLDLLRIPAPSMWVEWSDAIHQQVICQCEIVAQGDAGSPGRRVGLLLQGAPDGRSAVARTFWNVADPAGGCDVLMSLLETQINLDERFEPHVNLEQMLAGGYASVHCSDAGVAHDIPLLLAFFLLLNAKGAARRDRFRFNGSN